MSKSVLDKIGEAKREEKAEELHRQSEETLERAKKEEASRREYEAQLLREKRELIRMKQGLSDGGDVIKEEEQPKREYTLREKISNFIYHNKFYLIAGTVIAAVLIFLTVDFLKAERPDISVIYIAENFDMTYIAPDITDKWSEYTEDLNHDRKQLVKLYYIPAYYAENTEAQQYLMQADRTKLVGEFQSGDTIVVIGNKRAYDELGLDETCFVDARELFPDDPNAQRLGYPVAKTMFRDLIGAPDMNDSDLYFSFRKPIKTFGMSEEKMQANFDEALDWFTKFLEENRRP